MVAVLSSTAESKLHFGALSTVPLTPLSYVVLALVGEGGAGAHDLVRAMRQGGPVYWGGAPSGLYSEPKRLTRLGYLTARTEPGKTHSERFTRSPTPAARADRLARRTGALPPNQERGPPAATRRQHPDRRQILESFRGMLPELDQLVALARDMYEQASRVPRGPGTNGSATLTRSGSSGCTATGSPRSNANWTPISSAELGGLYAVSPADDRRTPIWLSPSMAGCPRSSTRTMSRRSC